MKSLPSSVRQLLTSRCTASSSRNSRNAYPADRERERGGEEREKSLLSTCISETLVKQDVCCTLAGTQLNLNKHLSNITLT